MANGIIYIGERNENETEEKRVFAWRGVTWLWHKFLRRQTEAHLAEQRAQVPFVLGLSVREQL